MERRNGRVERVEATRDRDTFVANVRLRPGDRVWVAEADVVHRWGNHNGAASPVVTVPSGR